MFENPVYVNTVAWVGFALVLFLCLPFWGTRKLVLGIFDWTFRLSALALLVGGAVLWFRPEWLPQQVVRVVNDIPGLRQILPSPGSPLFGLALGGLTSLLLLPFLAILDVTRKIANGRFRLRRVPSAVREKTVSPAPVAQPEPEPRRISQPVVLRRRQAAETMAEIGSRKLNHTEDDLP